MSSDRSGNRKRELEAQPARRSIDMPGPRIKRRCAAAGKRALVTIPPPLGGGTASPNELAPHLHVGPERGKRGRGGDDGTAIATWDVFLFGLPTRLHLDTSTPVFVVTPSPAVAAVVVFPLLILLPLFGGGGSSGSGRDGVGEGVRGRGASRPGEGDERGRQYTKRQKGRA